MSENEKLTPRQRVIQIIVIVFTIATAPAIAFRVQAALLLPQPARTIALVLLAAAFVYDIYLFVVLCRAKPTDFKLKRLTLQQVPRLLLGLALALVIDAPAYNLVLRNAIIAQLAYEWNKESSPVQLTRLLTGQTATELHFLSDPVYPWIASPFIEDPARHAYFALYVSPGNAHTRQLDECATFESLSIKNAVTRYPDLVSRLSKRRGKCADLEQQYVIAADAFTDAARRLDLTPDETKTIPFSAIMQAYDARASAQTMAILQSRVLHGSTDEQTWMRQRCAMQYRHDDPRWEGGLAADLAWQARWMRLFGAICNDMGVPRPPSFIADIIKTAKAEHAMPPGPPPNSKR